LSGAGVLLLAAQFPAPLKSAGFAVALAQFPAPQKKALVVPSLLRSSPRP
jgi:hypothetical protein